MGGLMLLQKIGLIFLLISASLFSTSLAGRQSVFSSDFEQKELGATHDEEEQLRHERVLKVNTKDYGRYDPTPALSKPPFKLIPN
ncbi:protein CASPARIAN STRIP INTEGRITY FACTOR 1-like [Lycium barbarum]|uniref:protein CASPARIAN STRIP INTEGRITY FACTOR 1-like n=1 Tax=Lycium ferocissimum TaxID=112874 RepID=UPI00281551A4|nr:protein CASPARIAN STRIP INTEGRITY FACTOR 1-like [Lycium ferocissimum]XP_060169322.1 protein CASPARIAN STRIP INTEGRITY FACTOR 1-like [Lycium barbarum]